jgi:hypothetical protein
MEFRIARAARVTGAMLERLVREALVTAHVVEPDCVVCYGAGYAGPKRALNAACSQWNKMQQGIALWDELKDEALFIHRTNNDRVTAANLPVIARKIKHAKGKDMLQCRTMRAVERAINLGREFFTPLVESDTEYRVWVYRKRILAVYEKRLTEPERNLKFGRNRANGWTFHQLESEAIPESVRRVAVAAVRALNLDFGAVDVLGKWKEDRSDVHATVLEVNSAPGVSDEHRSAIVKLVNRIVRWCANGCPEREV